MRDERAYLFDILDSASLIADYVKDHSLDEFLEDTLLQDAVLRRLAIIGEAVRSISESRRSELPDLPWHEMAGMRNILIHQYFGVDLQIVWDTATRDMNRLATAIRMLLDRMDMER